MERNVIEEQSVASVSSPRKRVPVGKRFDHRLQKKRWQVFEMFRSVVIEQVEHAGQTAFSPVFFDLFKPLMRLVARRVRRVIVC